MLRRKAPLRRGKPLARTGGLKRSGRLPRKRAKPRRGRVLDIAHLAFVRTLPCAMCARKPPSHAHHSTAGRGKGQKAGDDQAFALCFRCHQDLHDLSGPFKGWTQATLREWQAEQVAKVMAARAAA